MAGPAGRDDQGGVPRFLYTIEIPNEHRSMMVCRWGWRLLKKAYTVMVLRGSMKVI
jgi:hypothetical protein